MPPVRRSRSRSATTVPQRPVSSNSTASLRSGRTHEAGTPYPQVRSQPQSTAPPRMEEPVAGMTTDEFERILQAGELGNISQGSLDPQQQHARLLQNAQPGFPHESQTMSYDSQVGMNFDFDPQPPSHSAMSFGAPPADLETRRPRGSTNQTNENELKDMLQKNLARPLEQVADEVIQNERTSSAEKTKQLFAMLWLHHNLVQAKGSVPRTRVHTSYAARCAKLHLQPLNPASFGKLVRVIFPDIQTRRLGVRTKSKYHYVDLSLVGDVGNMEGEPSQQASALSFGHSQPHRANSFSMDMPRFQADSTLIPSEEQSTVSPVMPSTSLLTEPDIRVFPVPQDPVYAPNRPTATMTHAQRMKFASYHIMEANDKTDIVLPDISPYIPPRTDTDAANALATLYLTHVTNLVDCVRFCREKQFFRLFTSFQGTLTVPVQKLLVHPDVAPWVKECDYLMYQKMIKVIAPLTLQVMPPVVMKFFDAVSKLLEDHITKTFEGLPRHVLDAKLESSTIFGQLLQRMLRANQSAHAAGAILIDEGTRNRMWTEWVRFVNPKCMMTAIIPDCGYDRDVYNLLTHDVRALLLPLSTDANLERNTHYEIAAAAMNSRPQPAAFELDRMGNFLEGMKSRYARVPSRDLLHYIHGVTGHALRDITMENGSSYNCWLITKCFIDELTLWLVHAGGFLERRVPAVPNIDQAVNNGSAGFLNETNGGSNGGEGSGSHSRYSSLGSEFEPSGGNASDFQSNSMRAAQNLQAHILMQSHPNSSYTTGIPTTHGFATSFSAAPNGSRPSTAAPNGSRPSTAGGQSTDVDDSGIGMSLLDDDLDLKPPHALQKQFTSSISSLHFATTAGPDAMMH